MSILEKLRRLVYIPFFSVVFIIQHCDYYHLRSVFSVNQKLHIHLEDSSFRALLLPDLSIRLFQIELCVTTGKINERLVIQPGS